MAPLRSDCCGACGSTAIRKWGEKAGFVLHACHDCQSVEAEVPPRSELEEDPYDRLYSGASPQIPDVVRAVLRDLVRSFEPYRRSSRLCDLGFGAGTLLEIAEQEGWESHGTETSRVALDAGRSRGWRVLHPAELENAATFADSFDVVTGIEFIEHLADGRAELARAARTLRPGGLLYLTTPNIRSINGRLLGPRWSVVGPPEHRLLWSRVGLYRALRATGLHPLRAHTTGLNPSELVALARRAPTRASSRVEAAYRMNSWASGSRWRRGAKSFANRLLSTFGVGDTLKVWAERPVTSST